MAKHTKQPRVSIWVQLLIKKMGVRDQVGACSFKVVFTNFSSRTEEHTSELQSLVNLVCRLLLEKKKKI